MMSRPLALSFFAFSATAMIALGLARLMRSASSGIEDSLSEGKTEPNSSMFAALH